MFNQMKDVLGRIKPKDKVLDIGGAAEVFPRANVVIDILPYDERSPNPHQDMPEQFTRDDWFVGDICAPEIWKRFKDKEFDFIVCSHVLEDIRDPIIVCKEMIRIGKAGYIECPSRFRECAKGNPNDPVSGWEHHRWILDVQDDTLIFTPKLQWANQYDFLGDARRQYLADYFFQFTAVHWVGSFNYYEHAYRGSVVEPENQFYFYDAFDYTDPHPIHTIIDAPHRGKTFLWFSDYKLPVEFKYSLEEIEQKHIARMKGNP